MIKIVTDEENGILAESDCRFLGSNMELMYDSVCISFIPNLYSTNVIIICVSFFMFFGSFFLYFTAMRFYKIAEEEEK